MMRRLSLQSLVLAHFCPHPAAGFVSIRAPAAGGELAARAVGTFEHATTRILLPTNPAAASTRCSLERRGQRYTHNDDRRPRRYRRRRQDHVLRAAADAAEGAVAEVEEAACAAGSERSPHEPAVRAFEDWAVLAGCRGGSASLSHADFDGLRGIMAKAALRPWQPIVTVPPSLFLQEDLLASSASSASSAPAPLSAGTWQRCPWWVRLGVRLLNESVAGESSLLKEYVRMLPAPGETGTPLNWSPDQLKRLHYPRLLSQVKLQRRLFEGVDHVEQGGGWGPAMVDVLRTCCWCDFLWDRVHR